jgi:hypothetical protein
METTLIIDSETELARAKALVDQLWGSEDAAALARLKAQAGLIAAYEDERHPRKPKFNIDEVMSRPGYDEDGHRVTSNFRLVRRYAKTPEKFRSIYGDEQVWIAMAEVHYEDFKPVAFLRRAWARPLSRLSQKRPTRPRSSPNCVVRSRRCSTLSISRFSTSGRTSVRIGSQENIRHMLGSLLVVSPRIRCRSVWRYTSKCGGTRRESTSFERSARAERDQNILCHWCATPLLVPYMFVHRLAGAASVDFIHSARIP